MFWRGMLRPGMRVYLIPFAAGVTLAASTFLPWVIIGDLSLPGVPDVPALWVLGLGGLAAVLAVLSLITRKNSRHPLLLIGLIALGITFLSLRIMPRSVADRALTRSQALAIVDGAVDRAGARRQSPAAACIWGWSRHLCWSRSGSPSSSSA